MKTIAIVLTLATFNVYAEIAVKAAAKFESLSGPVQYRHKGGRWAEAKLGQALTVDTELETGPRASAVLIFANGSTLAMKSLTRVVIDQYGTGTYGTNIVISLNSGRLLAKIARYKNSGQFNHFRVRTPTAVAGVRGTIQEISYTPDKGTEIVMHEAASDAIDRMRARILVPEHGKSQVSISETLPADKTKTRESTRPMLSGQSSTEGENSVSYTSGDFNFSANSSDFTDFLRFYDRQAQEAFDRNKDILILEKL